MIRRVLNTTLGKQNLFGPNGTMTPHTQQEYVHEAIVVDVIVNEKHPEYAADGYNIGAIQFRMIKADMFKETSKLHWAMPIEANITEYPLLNEVVIIIPALNRFLYGRKINTSSRITAQPMFGINEEMDLPPNAADKITGYRKSVATPVQPTVKLNKLGNYFKDLENVYRLKHDEGDKLIEGRSGHSIRFGAAWKTENTFFKSTDTDQAPNILIRVGQSPTAKPTVNSRYGLVLEDINKDLSSIWMVSNQLVDLTYATTGNSVHQKSIDDFPPQLKGNQIVINTDRFVVNTKTDKIMGHSFLGIHWTTNRDFTVDVGRDYVSLIARDQRVKIDQDRIYKILRDNTVDIGRDEKVSIGQNETYSIGRTMSYQVGKDVVFNVSSNNSHTVGGNTTFKAGGFFSSTATSYHAFISPQIFLGMNGSTAQPVPQGTNLALFLMQFIDAHLANAGTHVITSMGPGALSAGVVSMLTKLKADVIKGARASFNSGNVFTK